jgi:hypothetical protein
LNLELPLINKEKGRIAKDAVCCNAGLMEGTSASTSFHLQFYRFIIVFYFNFNNQHFNQLQLPG